MKVVSHKLKAEGSIDPIRDGVWHLIGMPFVRIEDVRGKNDVSVDEHHLKAFGVDPDYVSTFHIQLLKMKPGAYEINLMVDRNDDVIKKYAKTKKDAIDHLNSNLYHNLIKKGKKIYPEENDIIGPQEFMSECNEMIQEGRADFMTRVIDFAFLDRKATKFDCYAKALNLHQTPTGHLVTDVFMQKLKSAKKSTPWYDHSIEEWLTT
jgi:hypothetical protein